MVKISSSPTPAEVWYVKARKESEKRYQFVGSGGELTRLRVHALMFSHEQAQNRVAVLASDNPGFDFKTQRKQ